jgi:hypothetical protein
LRLGIIDETHSAGFDFETAARYDRWKAKVKRQKSKERRMRGTARLSSSTVDESDPFRHLLF